MIMDSRWIGTMFFLLVQFILCLRWLHRQLRHDEVVRIFVQDIATNHLPHIYLMLQRLCRQQDIECQASPIVRWIDLS